MEEGRLGAARHQCCWSCPVQCCHSLSPQDWGPVKSRNAVRWVRSSVSVNITAFLLGPFSGVLLHYQEFFCVFFFFKSVYRSKALARLDSF